MNDTVFFYHNPQSRGRIVHWMLEEIGAPYEVKLLDFNKNEHKDPAYTKLNPMGKIPAIVHRGTVVTETPAICAYLADAFPAAKLAPTLDDPMRGTYLRWFFFAAGCVEYALVDKMLSRPEASMPTRIGYGTFNDTINTLEKAVTPGPFVLGDRFCAADLYIASQIGWGIRMKALEGRPVLESYAARCTDRPACKRAADQDKGFRERLK